jgi:glucose/arabinose dehydrogenase
VGGSTGSAATTGVSLTFTALAGTFDHPVFVTHAGDGSTRLYIVEQPGKIKIRLADGTLKTFLDITAPVLYGGERGLFSVAFHPDYERSGTWGYRRFYVNYTRSDGDIVVREYRRSSGSIGSADPNSGRTVLTVEHSLHNNHNGGLVTFGPDGYLWVSLGDGGGSGDPENNAENVNALLGKLLRIDPRPDYDSATPQYRIPAGNPFVGRTGRDEIWAYGLRNLWRYSFDRGTGNLLMADVGQDRQEEWNLATAAAGRGPGRNYGWDHYEGNLLYEGPSSTAGLTFPVGVYNHSDPSEYNCSITGGYVYRGASAAARGLYIFGDYCSGRIWSWSSATGRQLLRNTGYAISSFGEDPGGVLYLTDLSGGRVYRLHFSG